MAKRILLLILLLLLLLSTLTSCASQSNTVKTLITSKKSFVKILTFVRVKPNECKDGKKCEIWPWLEYSTGSGSVVRHGGDRAVLTAAHVCQPQAYGYLPPGGVEVMLKAIDRQGRKHIVKVLKFNVRSDICLLSVGELEAPGLKLSIKKPEYGEKVYNIAAPLGISHKEMVPMLEGNFSGNSGGRAFYTIPTVGGSSGSAIINKNGHLVGMIHSVHRGFHHLAVSASYKDLWNFLKGMPNKNLVPSSNNEKSLDTGSKNSDFIHLHKVYLLDNKKRIFLIQ